MLTREKEWDWEISSRTTWSGTLQELIQYRNLLARLVRKQFLVNYQQTILGPIWILLQPILTLITFVLVFGNLLGISTGSTPPLLFYYCGILLWNYFSEAFVEIAFTFVYNEDLFRKVYFPRIIIPASYLLTHFFRNLIQLALLLILLAFYWIAKDLPVNLNVWLLFVPFVFLILGGISLGLGLIFSVLAGKYRDLINVVYLIVRLAMFVTPVIYPMASVRPSIRWVVQLNPLSPLFEVFRYAFLGEGHFTALQLAYSAGFTLFLLFMGIYIFNKQGQKLMDVL